MVWGNVREASEALAFYLNRAIPQYQEQKQEHLNFLFTNVKLTEGIHDN